MNKSCKEKAKDLPQMPGVYIYKDEAGEVIYVGKAKNLRSRVGSYFQTKLDRTSKTYQLVSRINDIEYILVDNEFDALILEAELIKKYLPKYNIVLKDDKSFLYIVIRSENVVILPSKRREAPGFRPEYFISEKKVMLPKVLAERKTNLKPKDVKFGPFTSSGVTKHVIKVLRKVFQFRDCSVNKFSKYHRLGNPCLFGHIGLCLSPCVNFSLESLDAYKNNIKKIKKLLLGGSSVLLNELERKMKVAAKVKDFEEAAKYRDLIGKFSYIRQSYKDASEYINNPYLMDDLGRRSLEVLKSELPVLVNIPKRIECYDISNISGKQAVGSMIVATDGKIDKDEYKRFRIKLKETPDDVDMLFEVLHRRFHCDWEFPDLIVVDGGKGQVSAAESVLSDLNISIPVIGLAKKFETVVYRQNGKFVEINLPKDNVGLALLIRLRNEAHRFAQSYHHLLRLKSLGV